MSTMKRRERVAGRPGIYRRLNEDGSAVSGVYEIVYRDETGKQRWHVVHGKLKDALDKQAELRSKKSKGEMVSPTKITFGEVWKELDTLHASLIASGKRSARTSALYRQHYGVHLESRLGSTPIQRVTAHTLSDLLSDLRTSGRVRKPKEGQSPGLKENTVRAVMTLCSAILTHAVEREYIASSPMRKLPKRIRPAQGGASEARALDAKQLRTLIEKTATAYQPLVATLAYSGLRISEALGLVWSDIDLQAGELHVRKQLSRASKDAPAKRVQLKTRRSFRRVPISKALDEILRAHRQDALSKGLHGSDRFVFCTLRGTPLHYKNVSDRALSPAADKAKLNPPGTPRLSFDDLRHSFASNLILSGVDITQVAAWLGDSPDLVWRVYSHEIGSQPERVKRGQAALAQAFS